MKKPGSFSGWLHVFVMSYDGANVNYSEMTTDAFDVEQQLRVPSREPVSRHRCQSCCQLNSFTAQRDWTSCSSPRTAMQHFVNSRQAVYTGLPWVRVRVCVRACVCVCWYCLLAAPWLMEHLSAECWRAAAPVETRCTAAVRNVQWIEKESLKYDVASAAASTAAAAAADAANAAVCHLGAEWLIYLQLTSVARWVTTDCLSSLFEHLPDPTPQCNNAVQLMAERLHVRAVISNP